MNSPVLRWPLHAVPDIRVAGFFALDERNFKTTYRHDTHALHLHEYAGAIRVDRHRFALRPGDVKVSVSRGHTQYDLPQPGHHGCVHFCPVKARGPLTALLWHVSLASPRNYLADRMAEIARLHNQPRRPIAQARAALLLWIAWLMRTGPLPPSQIAVDNGAPSEPLASDIVVPV